MEWVQTDEGIYPDGYTQYVKRLSDVEFMVLEHDIVYIDEVKKYVGRQQCVNLEQESESYILEVLELYGYEERQEPQIEAECLAECNMETEIISSDFADILTWEREKGITGELEKCEWCEEEFEEEELKNTELGTVCEKCRRAIESRGEKLNCRRI